MSSIARSTPDSERLLEHTDKTRGASADHVDESAASMGFVHSVETLGAVDGPGIRFVVFVSGCPLRCQYCHNPDCMTMKNGERRAASEVVAEIATYASFLRRAGGGLTVSGGEPLLQAEFTHAMLKGARALRLHTALDTSGFLGDRASDALLDDVDLVLLDIKSGDPTTYKRITGVELQPTLDFARRLSAMGKPMWIRFVLVPGLTDAESNIEPIAAFVSTLESVERVEILPFHQMGAEKWAALGLDYKLEDAEPPSDEQLGDVRRIFARHGVEAL